MALRTGQKTFKQIAAENGSDWQKQVDDICEVLEYAREKHGVDLGGVILGQKKADGLYEGEDEAAPADDANAPGTDDSAQEDNGDGQDGGNAGADHDGTDGSETDASESSSTGKG